MKIYKGIRTAPGYHAIVYVDEQVLDLTPSKVDIHDYGADSPEWGYFGSGPSQTAAAILYDIIKDADITKKYHQEFKREYIAQFDQNGFILLETQVLAWLADIQSLEEGL